MKRLITIAALALGFVLSSAASDFVPTTTWPYVYEDFTSGEAILTNGQHKKGLYNIVLTDSKLHFVEGDLVNEARMFDVAGVTIGEDYYVNVGGKLYKVLSKSDEALVVEGSEIDYARLNSTTGAYGSSANSVSTQSLSSLEGIGGTRANMNHMELKNSKESGKSLSLITKKYIAFNGIATAANKRDILSLAARYGKKSEVAAYIKTSKVKWNSPVSLQGLADFLARTLK